MNDAALRILRAMTPAQKIRAAALLYHSTRRLKAAALRAQHPEWTEIEALWLRVNAQGIGGAVQ